MKKTISNQGFTLVEVLVTIVIAGVVMAGVYSAYYAQQRSYSTQQQVVAVQQNIRAAMYFMERDIRMAGYDPTDDAGAVISTADPNVFEFTYDYDGDGTIGSGETIRYETYPSGGITCLRRTPGGSAVAEHVDALNFVYLDESGSPTSTIEEIRAVQVTLVVRTAREESGYSDPVIYTNQQGTPIYTPTGNALKYRRRVLRAELRCRNLGLV
ncbi:MAG: prepilin-type N-terminal cleavage/methylation domain-containing protein [Deltaproteobacteria bacterium]|nr:prepilin-type N-terminal cleavage/methylation domain-containing protein [Deltaproteobacteria bacterium]